MSNLTWLSRKKKGRSSAKRLTDPTNQHEYETLSASINLDDIIQDYDETSKKSKSNSISSFLNTQLSQSYFSVIGSSNDDETTSFYSALQDGFPLDHCNLRDSSNYNPDGEDHSLQIKEELSTESEKMLQDSHFKVSWSDLTYTIKPKITLTGLLSELDLNFRSKFTSAVKLITRGEREKTSYDVTQDSITILRNISGSFKSGELTAVMGPSGAGKTTLLNFLSRRREDGYSGCLSIDSSKRVKISTIPQNDQLPLYLTVRENLMFASRLNNPEPGYNHRESVERVGKLLGLEGCFETRTKKISGGQQKRLSIAQELLSKPDILILDEPTSGLDSLTCFKTITELKNLVKASQQKLIDPIAIVLTIHQPQHDVFDIFDRIYVLANHGITIYDGPPRLCANHISRYSGVKLPDEDYNPASFIIEIASGEFGHEPIEALARQQKLNFKADKRITNSEILDFSTKFKQTQLTNNSSNSKGRSSIDMMNNNGGSPILNGLRYKSNLFIDERIGRGSKGLSGGFFIKTCILSQRYWMSIIKDPKQIVARLLFLLFLPIALAIIVGTEPGSARACPRFSGQYELKDLVNNDTLTSIDVQEELLLTLENLALLFIIVYALSCSNIASTTLSFSLDLQSSLKEHYNGWYSMSSYLIARTLVDIPLAIVLPTLSLSLGYELTGQRSEFGMATSLRVLIIAVAVILGTLIGQALAMIVGAIYIGHLSTALFASQGVTLPLVFLSGFVVRTKNMSKLVYSLSQLSFYRHMLEITTVAKYGFNMCDCNPKEVTGKDVELNGVPDELRSFTKNWMSSMGAQEQVNGSGGETDVFQIFAKQILLYNTYGVDVKSCEDVIPYQLHDLSVGEKDLTTSFMSLISTLIFMQILLFLTVKFVVQFRTSL